MRQCFFRTIFSGERSIVLTVVTKLNFYNIWYFITILQIVFGWGGGAWILSGGLSSPENVLEANTDVRCFRMQSGTDRRRFGRPWPGKSREYRSKTGGNGNAHKVGCRSVAAAEIRVGRTGHGLRLLCSRINTTRVTGDNRSIVRCPTRRGNRPWHRRRASTRESRPSAPRSVVKRHKKNNRNTTNTAVFPFTNNRISRPRPYAT